MTPRPPFALCTWCQTLSYVEEYRAHLPCPAHVRRQEECAALGHRLVQRWVGGVEGCGYCGTAL